jgi:hypothetical protein
MQLPILSICGIIQQVLVVKRSIDRCDIHEIPKSHIQVYLQPSALLVKAVASCRYWLVCSEDVQEQVLERDENVKHLVAKVGDENKASRNHSVHEVVVRCRNNGDQNKGRVSETNKEIEYFPEGVLAHLSSLESAAEDARMVDYCHADAKGIAKVHRRHGGELVDKLAAHPHALSVVMADSVEEAVLFGEQAGRHAWVYDECHEGAEVRERQSAAGSCKCVE